VEVAYDPVRYKQSSRDNWNSVAPDYHSGWAGAGRGPFRSTKELVVAAGIRKGDRVLDLACGTGAVSAEAWSHVGPSGMLAVAVHGTAQGVPYFSTVMEPVLKRIPDIRPEGTPTVHRFGNPGLLKDVIASAGFSAVSVKKFVFSYDAGTFEQYWSEYMSTTAASIRSKIEADRDVASAIRKESEVRARQYTRNGAITFPWDVLVATAVNR
jgi:hypothetical protein